MNPPAKLSAVIATILLACTLGVLVGVGSFGVIRMVGSMLEGLGMLPIRWGENNLELMMELSGLLALPAAGWFLMWFFKKAVAAETELHGYKYTPPEGKSAKR